MDRSFIHNYNEFEVRPAKKGCMCKVCDCKLNENLVVYLRSFRLHGQPYHAFLVGGNLMYQLKKNQTIQEVKILAVSNDSYYKPDEALHELQIQETIMKALVDVQVVLRILVDKKIVTREEVQKYRNEVSNSPKYKLVLDDIQRQKRGFQAAKDNPQEYLKAIFNAKMNGDIKQ